MPPFSTHSDGLFPPQRFMYNGQNFTTPVVETEPCEIKSLAEALQLLEKADMKIAAQNNRIRQLETVSITDDLTGLMNRRGMMTTLRRELAASRRNKKNDALLIMLDLDAFKQVNDLYGHAIGDTYLQCAASVLLNEVRSCDYVARLGGDEFAILLTQISPKDAAWRLDLLKKTFNKRVMHSHNLSLTLRGSFGFALLSETETPESLLIAADMKLYASKAQRRKEANKEVSY